MRPFAMSANEQSIEYRVASRVIKELSVDFFTDEELLHLLDKGTKLREQVDDTLDLDSFVLFHF